MPTTRPPQSPDGRGARGAGTERRAAWHYRIRGYRILARNVWIGGYELDLVARRGAHVVFVEVKGKSGSRWGDPLEMVNAEKQRRLRRAAEGFLVVHPELAGLRVSFEVIAERGSRLERVREAF
jgi:putative endonuclease